MRFTLSKLFLAVAMVALACAGLIGRNRWWAESIVTLSIVLYVAVALLSIGRDMKTKIFRIAFSAIGGGYLLLVLYAEPIRQVLLTDHLLTIAGKSLQVPLSDGDTSSQGRAPSPGFGGGGGPGFGGGGLIVAGGSGGTGGGPFDWDRDDVGTLQLNIGTQAGAFFVIGHCIWSWLFALLGGWLASFMYSKFQKSQKN